MNTTDVVVGLVTIFLLAWETWTLVNKVEKDEISQTIWKAVQKWPVIGFLAGLLCGHWFWPQQVGARMSIGVSSGVWLAVIAIGLLLVVYSVSFRMVYVEDAKRRQNR